MQHSKLSLYLLGLFVFLPLFETFAQKFNPSQSEYLWPTNTDIYLSASFGETRFSHFHAGIDIKTWGREGFEIYATRDGILHRLGVSPYGYGNVIYLKHNDGSFSVYGHLRNFIPKLETLADSIRMSDYSYRFNQNVESEDIYFKKGDLIAYSGSSGAGPAHIHYELRTPTESPFNPLMTNIAIKDQIKPRFSRISVEPLSRDTKIQSKNRRILRRPRQRNGIFDFGEVRVEGLFGISVDISDRANDVLNVYAVHKIELFVNDELFFLSSADSFSYSQTRMVKIDRVYELLNSTRKGYQKLYRTDGNTLPFYKVGSDLKGLNLPVGTHQIEIRATDFSGNSATATLKVHAVKAKNRPLQHELRVYEKSRVQFSGSWDAEIFNKWDWAKNDVVVQLQEKDYILATAYKYGEMVMNCGLMNGDLLHFSEYDSVVFKGPEQLQSTLVVLNPNASDNTFELLSNQSNFHLSLPKSAVLDTMPLMLMNTKDNGVMVFPDTYPLMEDYLLTYRASSNEDLNQQIFVQKNRGSDVYAGGWITTDSKNLTMSTYFPGTFYLSKDLEPPTLFALDYYRRKRDRKRLPGFKVKDNLSGINLARTQVWMNGIRGIAEYNPDMGVLMYYHPDYKIKSGDQFRVLISDQAGNQTEITLPIP